MDTPTPKSKSRNTSGSGSRPAYHGSPSSAVTLSLDLERYSDLMAIKRQKIVHYEGKVMDCARKMHMYQKKMRLEAEELVRYTTVAECISQTIQEEESRLNSKDIE